MKAKKCDRCGTFYEDYEPTEEQGGANTVLTSYVTPSGQGKTKAVYDLCPDCMENQVKFLRNEAVESGTPSVSPSEPPTSDSGPSEGKDTTQGVNGDSGPSEGHSEGLGGGGND